VECVDIAEHLSFNLGNALKYLWRSGLKNEATAREDLEKALWYLNREEDLLFTPLSHLSVFSREAVIVLARKVSFSFESFEDLVGREEETEASPFEFLILSLANTGRDCKIDLSGAILNIEKSLQS
jgi:hypothetical protein